MAAEMKLKDSAALGKQMLARRLLLEHAAACGYPGQAVWAHWAWHCKWLDLPRSDRPASFYDYVIRELSHG